MKLPPLSLPRLPRNRRGVALIIVLAFVVLLTGLIVAFFSRAMSDRQVSNSGANETKANFFAQGAADRIIGYLQQEIAMASTPTPLLSGTIYTPLTPASMLPYISGTAGLTAPAANLLVRSAGGQNFYVGSSHSLSGSASGVSSAAPSLDGRSVSLARWNSHYLLPLPNNLAPNSTDSTPQAGTFAAPDWVLVDRGGSTPTAWSAGMVTSSSNSATVVGRYAYAIYHEGGMLDANVAGYPLGPGYPGSPITSGSQSSYKPALAYADLTQIGLTQQQSDQLVGWRNDASAQTTGTFPNLSFNAGAGLNFYRNVIANASGFLRVSGTALNRNNQSDRMFGSRQELIRFMRNGLGLSGTNLNCLNYLATFTRDLNQPSYVRPQSISAGSKMDYNAAAPKIVAGTGGNDAVGGDNVINPSLLAVRVQTSFARNDGSIAKAGDPLVNKRFALSRLAWITYRGPSADNMNDPVVQQSITGLGGNPSNSSDPVYQLVAQGNAASIYNYFGLSWVPDPNNAGSYEWIYSHQGTKPLTSAAPAPKAAINTLASVAGRDPDFFELMKAGICVGSLGKTYSTITGANSAAVGTPGYYEANRDQSVDTQVTQIVANIVNQFKADGYPTRILNNFTGTLQEVRGVGDLPYIYSVRQANLVLKESTPASNTCPQVVATTAALQNPGAGVVLEEPCIWNPHARNPSVSGTNPRPTSFRAIAVSTDPLGGQLSGISLQPSWRDNSGKNGSNGKGYYFCPTASPVTLLTATNTELDFQIPNGYSHLFREPTLLIKPGVPTGSGLQAGPSNTLTIIPGGGPYLKSVYPAGQYTANSVPDNLEYLGFVVSGTSPLPVSWTTKSLTKDAIATGNPVTSSTAILTTEYFNTLSGSAITYRLQYLDAISGNYLTYDEKYAPFSCANSYNGWNSQKSGYGRAYYNGNTLLGPELQVTCFDPRTSRFGIFYASRNGGRGIGAEDMPIMERGYNSPYTSGNTGGWASPMGTTGNNATSAAQNAIWTNRPDEYQGYPFGTYNGLPIGFCHDTGPVAQGWYPLPPGNAINDPGYTCAVLKPGLYTQNNPGVAVCTSPSRFLADNQNPGPPALACFADADGVVRRGMSAYVLPTGLAPATAPINGAASGLPMKTAYTYSVTGTAVSSSEAASRPIILNRPFHSVAELGYAFSDTPWRNLDFSTPESGAAALLDLFSLSDTAGSNPLVAGKVNLNTQQVPVLQAILAGAYRDEFALSTTALAGNGGAATADKIAAALVRRTGPSTSNPQPLTNIADLVGRWSSSQTIGAATAPLNINGAQSYIGFSGTDAPSTFIASSNPTELSSVLARDNSATGYTTMVAERYREAAIRSLANVGQTRVWNLMIDLIAQTGRYPSGSNGTLANFLVEGEQHYWVHVAIDRYTGQVIDKQVEIVKQ